MIKVIFPEISTTQKDLFKYENTKKILSHSNLVVQSFVQNTGHGRGSKVWFSPKGNIYLTINTLIKQKDILSTSFYICFLVHKFIKKRYSIDLQYKWPNDLYYKNLKILGVIANSKIIGKNSITQIGLGLNTNKSPIKTSIHLSKIIKKKISVYSISNDLLSFINKSLAQNYSVINIVRYLNKYLLKNFSLNHPKFINFNKIKILAINNDLSLKININSEIHDIYFGELE